MAIQPDGKMILAGSAASGGFALARYNSDGSLDTTFGSGGKITTDYFGNLDQANAVAIQPDGKIIAAGVAKISNTDFDFALARYEGDEFDTCLQDDSNGNLLQINTTTGDYLFTNCQGFTAGGTGLLTRRGSTITLQHNAVDRRVVAKIDTSVNKATASVQVFSQGATQTVTDRNITNNSCSCQ